MNHLILTLPNPDKDFFKNFETEIYQYLWDGKIHKVKKNIIIHVQEYRFGGLKRLDNFEFITALKSSWIRRLMQCRTQLKKSVRGNYKRKSK